MNTTNFLRFVSVVVSAAMVVNCCGSGLASATASLVQGFGNEQPPFTERPGPVWLGRHPGRLAEPAAAFILRARTSTSNAQRGNGTAAASRER